MTPQGLTEERIDGEFHYALAAGFPSGKYWDIFRNDGAYALATGPFDDDEIAHCRPIVEGKIEMLDKHARHFTERERERVNGLADSLGTLDANCDRNASPAWEVHRPASYDDGRHGEGDTFIEALEKATALSPDVLGDQKDKGKATGK